MSGKKPSPAVSVFRSVADARMAMVYDGPDLVATLKRDGSGWNTAFYRSSATEDGKSVWVRGPDHEPTALTTAADRAFRLIPPKLKPPEAPMPT